MLSRSDKVRMLTDDLHRSIRTGDKALHDRTVAEFMNLQAQDARDKDDKIQLYILSIIEECGRLNMRGAQSLFTALALFQKFEQLDFTCRHYLAPVAVDLSEELTRIVGEYARKHRESQT